MYNVPLVELQRSPSAQIVGKLAEDSGLFLTHFEHRHHLSPPPSWLPTDRPDLAGELSWQGGILKEHKYQHFRYDQPLGSLHPGHRAKWTAHELCHGLAGFTWRSDMTPLAHTLSARLSEVLPVALWYFFDEVQLRRCPLHYLQGALFQDHCVYCEQVAQHGPRLPEPEDEKAIHEGIKFVKAEFAMIAKSKRFGRPLPNRYATLDLNSDALAYVAQNLRRMEDPVFRMFIELFHGHHTGMWADLDELEGRVWGLCEALSGGLPANPLPAGRAHWIAQDLGWRLLLVSTQCEDAEAIDRLESLAEGLARNPEDLQAVFDGYQDLHESFFLPDPENMFAVGYPLPSSKGKLPWGSDYAQLFHGIDSACPSLAKALGKEGLSEQISGFAEWDLEHPRRLPIGKRFARFLVETASGPLADLASYEAAIQHPDPPDPWSASLSWSSPEGELVRIAQGVEILKMSVEVDTLIKALEDEDEERDIPEREHWMLICNQPGGVRRIIEISDQSAHALTLLSENPVERRLLNLDDEDWEMLTDVGAITPCSWHLYVPEVVPTRSITTDGPLPDAFALTSSRGLWRQATTVTSFNHDDDESAFEPTPISEDHEDHEDHAHRSSSEEDTPPQSKETVYQADEAIKSLAALNLLFFFVWIKRSPYIKSRLTSKRRRATRPAPSIAFAAAPQISTAEALEDIGYREDRPPMNTFEEQLRQALSGQASDSEDELEGLDDGASYDQLEDLEGLFNFKGLEDQVDDDLIVNVAHESDLINDSEEFLSELSRESDTKTGVMRYLDEAKIEIFDDLQGPEEATHVDVAVDDQQGEDVGFGDRWTDWNNE
jgi:hypothetical protein